jgi:hypothetical protein
MPLSNKQLGNTFIQGPNISIYPSGNTFAISGNTTSTGTTGFIALTSAGTGNRLIASSITNNNLIYKSLTGTSNLSVNDDNNGTLTFSLLGGTGTIISGTNVGTNANSIGFFTGLSTTTNPNDTLAFRNLLAGPNISISPSVANNGDILISRGSPILVNQISNIGGGAIFLSSITSNSAITRTIANASGFSSALGAGIITIPTSSTDSDSTAFITAASITDSTQIAAIENLVTDLKTANIWNKMLAIYPLVGGNANSHKYNLKDPRDANDAYRLDFGSLNVIHDSNGISSNAADGATQPTINTFIQLNLVSSLTNNIHLSFYSRTNANDGLGTSRGSNIGNTTGSSFFRSYPRYGGIWYCQIGDSGTVFPTVSDSLGFYIASRTSSTGNTFYKNGFLSAITSNTVHLSSITASILLMRLGTNPENTKQMAFYSFGSGLTNSEALAYTTAVENYQTTLSRQVVTLQNQTVRIAPTNTTASLLYISNATSQLGINANFGADATTGSLGIGGAAVTTSRLLIAAGTGAISQLRLTAFSASTSLIDGDIWYSTSGNTLKFYKNNISTDFIFKDNNISLTGLSKQILQVDTAGTISRKYVNSLGVFDGATKTITYTNLQENLEYSIIGTPLLFGNQTLLAPTNIIPPFGFITSYNPQLITGKKFRFTARCNLYYDGIDPTFFNYNTIYVYFKIKIGETEIALGGFFIDGEFINPYSGDIELDVTFTIKDLGLIACSGKIITYTTPSPITSNPIIFGINSLDASISTELDQLFDCVVYATTNGGPDWYFTDFTLQVYESFLEVLN